MPDNKSLVDTYAVIPAPVAGRANFADTVGLTHIRQLIHADWKGRRVNVTAIGGHVMFLTGGESVEASYTADHGGTAPNWTVTSTVGGPVPDTQLRDFFIEKSDSITHFSIIASAADTRVWITPSDLAEATPTHSHTS
jgi:hypothetical protein